MAAVTTAVVAIVGLILGWVALEMACKPCLEKGRQTIDRSLDPNYDPDDELDRPYVQAPPQDTAIKGKPTSSTHKAI